MAEKKITRKVITKKTVEPVPDSTGSEVVEQVEEPREAVSVRGEAGRARKACYFCQSKTKPTYTDTNILRRFVTDRAKIVPKAKSGLCSKHQRVVTRNIKYARHLSLLPFTPQV